MKIVSKYRDYYDYLQGIWGVDEKLILERNTRYTMTYTPSTKSVETFHIGEWVIEGIWINGKLYFGDEIEKFSDQSRKVCMRGVNGNVNPQTHWYIPDGVYSNLYCLKEPKFLGHRSPTWVENCPILIEGYGNYKHYPILKNFGINRFLTPEWVWFRLNEWLSKRNTKNEPEMPVGDDNTRILSAGFDLKTSFRGKSGKSKT